jgi:hypothetical protein
LPLEAEAEAEEAEAEAEAEAREPAVRERVGVGLVWGLRLGEFSGVLVTGAAWARAYAAVYARADWTVPATRLIRPAEETNSMVAWPA